MTRIRHAADTVLRRSPVQRAFRGRAARRVAVLAYHGIDDPACFRRQLGYLAKTMRPVSMDDVLRAMYGGRSLPARAVLLTAGILDVTTVVIGGGVARSWDLLAPAIASALADEPPVSGAAIRVEPSTLGPDAVALGAAAQVRRLVVPARLAVRHECRGREDPPAAVAHP